MKLSLRVAAAVAALVAGTALWTGPATEVPDDHPVTSPSFLYVKP